MSRAYPDIAIPKPDGGLFEGEELLAEMRRRHAARAPEIKTAAGIVLQGESATDALRAGLATPVHPNGRTLSRHNGSILRK